MEEAILLALQQQREDSGIDSDDDRMPNHHRAGDDSGSDEEAPLWAYDLAGNDDNMIGDDINDDAEVPMITWRYQLDWLDDIPEHLRRNDSRKSPPLFEVELTASDEEDEASVLELVIPMHSSRYQRIPTSATAPAPPPKRGLALLTSAFIYSLTCCFHK